MKKHFNLYYLLMEDREKNPMSEQKHVQIQKIIEAFYRKKIPPQKALPPKSEKEN